MRLNATSPEQRVSNDVETSSNSLNIYEVYLIYVHSSPGVVPATKFENHIIQLLKHGFFCYF